MQVTKLWEDLDTDMKMMRLQWLYRPHDTAQGRVPDQVENSVCLSNHADDNPLDTFLAPAFVQFVRGEAAPHGLTTYVCRHRYDGSWRARWLPQPSARRTSPPRGGRCRVPWA